MILGLFFLSNFPSMTYGTESSDDAFATAVAAIEQIGGSVRQMTGDSDDLEVQFQIRGRQLTDKGLAHVAVLQDTASLNLRGTGITSAGLVHLKRLTKLRRLHLERTAVTDAGMINLAGLANLEYLNLYATKITDRSLEYFSRLKKLKKLYVWQTGVTDVGVARLQEALPDLKIVRGVDLSKLPVFSPIVNDSPKPTTNLKWIETSDAAEVPKSESGINTQVYFENQLDQRVKLYWKSYSGRLTLYAELDPGAKRQQNSYSDNSWLITDKNDKPLGYFIVGTDVSRAVIPK